MISEVSPDKKHNHWIWPLIIIALVVVFVVLCELIRTSQLLRISKIFYNFAVGLGAVLAGIGAMRFIFEGVSLKRKQRLIENFKKQYPKIKMPKDFMIVNSPILSGKIYIINKKTGTKHWIESSQTFTDLGFFWDDVTAISADEFNKCQEGEGILTSGKPGF